MQGDLRHFERLDLRGELVESRDQVGFTRPEVSSNGAFRVPWKP